MPYDELQKIIIELQNRTCNVFSKKQLAALTDWEKAIKNVAKSWSGSSIGYHANIYYKGFIVPPADAHFSVEWGLYEGHFIQGTTGEWEKYTDEEIDKAIFGKKDKESLAGLYALAKETSTFFEDKKMDALSIISTCLAQKEDPFLSDIQQQIEKLRIYKESEILEINLPKGQFATRDTEAAMQGWKIPEHKKILAKILAIKLPVEQCGKLSGLVKSASSHIKRNALLKPVRPQIGTKIFIGHGRSNMWKDLKDFLQDRLDLPWDEFNREPVAGITNIQRLSQMLEDAAFAFLVMTGEDVKETGEVHARLNVIHEAGLFQGRLGFEKAIILLEEGCEEFSNIQGLGQIRFPKGNIKAKFEEIREVLEREGLI